MSANYYVFAEAKINNRWVCINPYYKDLKTGKFVLSSLYWSGSRTMFSNAFEKLEYIGEKPFYKDNVEEKVLSEEVLAWLQDECGEDILEDEDWTKHCIVTVPEREVVRNLGNPVLYDYIGIVKKHDIALYEAGEIEDFDVISPEELKELPILAQDMYQIYEWDDFYGWRKTFKKLALLTKACVDGYCSQFWLENTLEVRLVVFMF